MIGLSGIIIGVFLLAGSPSAWALGPSFDCDKFRRPETQLICATPDLSRAELAFTQTYYALRQTVGEDGWQRLKTESIDFSTVTLRQCRVPSSGSLPPDTSDMVSCLARAYERQRAAWLSRLSGPAADEARRPIERHVALQSLLRDKGFLPSAARIDGVYGSATRSAISAWQRANNLPVSSFLGDTDASMLDAAVAPTVNQSARSNPVVSARPVTGPIPTSRWEMSLLSLRPYFPAWAYATPIYLQTVILTLSLLWLVPPVVQFTLRQIGRTAWLVKWLIPASIQSTFWRLTMRIRIFKRRNAPADGEQRRFGFPPGNLFEYDSTFGWRRIKQRRARHGTIYDERTHFGRVQDEHDERRRRRWDIVMLSTISGCLLFAAEYLLHPLPLSALWSIGSVEDLISVVSTAGYNLVAPVGIPWGVEISGPMAFVILLFFSGTFIWVIQRSWWQISSTLKPLIPSPFIEVLYLLGVQAIKGAKVFDPPNVIADDPFGAIQMVVADYDDEHTR